MSHTPPLLHLLSANELARKIDVPYQTLIRMVRAGEIIPDAVSGRFYLFNKARLSEIVAAINLRRGAHIDLNVPMTVF